MPAHLSKYSVMRHQRESMHVARFLSGLPSSYDPVRSQILGARNLPSLSEVFSHLRQASLSDSISVSPSIPDCSALTTTVSGLPPRGFG